MMRAIKKIAVLLVFKIVQNTLNINFCFTVVRVLSVSGIMGYR